MAPRINKGDVVIIEKIDNNYESLKKGQVIAFKYEEKIIVHRLKNIVKDGNKYYFYTKGDANQMPDEKYVTKDSLLGKVMFRIRYIGKPTLWLHDVFNKEG